MERRGRSLITCGLLLGFAALVSAGVSAGPASDRPGLRLAPRGGGVDRTPIDFTLTLGETRFDPLVEVPLFGGGWNGGPAFGPDLRLVQFVGPIQEAWLASLQDRGLRVVQYIHPYTYIAWGDRAAAERAWDVPGVRWVGDFLPAYRVMPDWRNLSATPIDVHVLLCRGADPDAAVRRIVTMGATSKGRRAMDTVLEIAHVTIAGERLVEVAAVPGVYSIQLVPVDGGLRSEMSSQVNVGNVDADNYAYPGYREWLSEVGVDGDGVIMANVDGGIQDSHTDLVKRMGPCSGPSCGGSATSSHGTHTAGTMAADGSSGVLDSNGFLRGMGVAPGATLVEQVYYSFGDPNGMYELMTDSVRSGAILSSNSWGPSGSPQGYDDDTRQVDVGVRDADPALPGDQPLTYVLAFMNGNGGTSSQGTPDEAKNIFTIGCTKMRTGGGNQDPDIDDLASNSAHGPALDGRTIPHMVAPGCSVDSTVPTNSHGLMCGTSMACPQVAGAVGLFVEYYRSLPGYEDDPSPALVKAAFLPVARDLAGNEDADGNTLGHPFDSKQGWGRLALEAVVAPPVGGVRYHDEPVVLDATGEEWSTVVSPLDPSKPIRIMLAWTDAPGHGLGGSTPAWNNDLDLIVSAGASTWYGNNFGASGWSATGGSPDDRNNTEGVFLGPTPPSNVTITVRGANITSDGVPGVGDGTDQDFALVCYNCAQDPGFTLDITPATASVCAPDDVDYTITVGQVLGFDEPVTLSTSFLPIGVAVSFSDNPVVPPVVVTMTLDVSVEAQPAAYAFELTGDAESMDITVPFGLVVADGTPSAVLLSEPDDGSTEVSVTPNFTWEATEGAASYTLQVADNSLFVGPDVHEATTTETSHELEDPLPTDTIHYWRVRASNGCGDGAWSEVWSFRTVDTPSILLVDDDDNGPDVRSYYTDALDALGLTYNVWDTNNSDNEPGTSDLATYQLVIWFTGDEWGGSAGPGASGEAALGTWLTSGGTLFISSQDYLWDRGQTSFMTSYLGVGSYDDDVQQSMVTGQGELFGDVGTISLNYPFTNFSDIVSPGSGDLAFSGNEGDAAVMLDNGTWRTTFWGFPWEAVSSSDREDLLQRIVEWAMPEPACPADVDGNGTVDVSDILAVLAAWGGTGGAADVNADGTVDVSDLLAVIAAWGPC